MAMPKARRPRAEHIACHIAHIHDWPVHAKVWLTWGCQGWVPGVVVGYQRTRVIVRITGKAQSGHDVLSCLRWRNRNTVSRSPNNLIARRGDQQPKKYQPAPCLLQAAARGNNAGIPPAEQVRA